MLVQFGVLAGGAARPGIVLHELLGKEEAGTQRFAADIIGDDAALHIIDADALDPGRGALQIAGFLAVELDEGGAIIHRLLLGRDLAQQVGGPDMDAAIAADMQFVATVDADHAEILDRRLRAVAGAARRRDLELVGHPRAPGHMLDLDAKAGGILGAETAPFGPHAGLHRAQRLAIGMARHHAGRIEIGPDGGQVFFPDAEDIQALAAGHLDHRGVIFFDHVGDRAQFLGVGEPAPHARHDRVGAILLDVGVHPFVDETAALVVLIVARQRAEQIIIERRTAGGAALRR